MHSNEAQREAGELEDEEEMSAAERDLADDAQWKLIQKNTFTRWANEHLKTVNKALGDLETDLGDGLRLLSLVEVLSGKKFKHVNKRPTFRTQKLENVTMVLEFLERDEGIRIVNIDSSDIVDKKLKLILGLIWTLILHYSISMPMWEGEEPTPSEGGPTPKQRLLNWIQTKIPDLPIKNFTTDWNDGRAIGALVDAVGPGLCPDWEDWDPKKGRQNAKEAMDAAEKWLDVPQLIKPDEMTNPKVDEMSMMTYLSQFPNAKLKPNAPTRPRLNVQRVRAWGPGLEKEGNHKGAPARFTIETFSAGKGEVEVIILNPRGVRETCEVVFNNDRNLTYSCCYVPTMEGKYKVIIKFSGKEIPKSPYEVNVEGAAGDASRCKAYGPGLERSGNMVNKRTYFEVDTTDAGQGTVDVVILDPHGRKDSVRPAISKKEGAGAVYNVEYIPLEAGLHSVNVFFAGSAIPGSPFGVGVSPAFDAKRCYATGRGIQPKGIRVKDEADFKVHCKGAGEADLIVQIIGPGGTEVKSKIKKLDADTYEVVYAPVQQGHYVINVTYGGQHITKSPFKVEVGPYKESRIRAYGPGLESGVVNQPAVFTVETNGETGALGFSIEGPSQAKIDCKDNGDGSADVTYWPTMPGDYAIHILCNEEDIPKSPYVAEILPASPDFDASKVTAYGPGLEKTGVFVNVTTEFTVDARKGGKAPLKVSCFDVDYKPVDVQIQENRDGTYICRYTAKRNVKHTIIITYGGVNIPNSPYRVYVQESSKPEKVRVFGPGVEKGVKTFVRTYFVVDCKNAGPGEVSIQLTDEQGRDVPVETVDNGDGTFNVEYEPQTVGTYTVGVFYSDQPVPNTPIKVNVQSSIDLSKVKVVGLEPRVAVGEPREIKVLSKGAGPPPAPRAVPGCKTQSKVTPRAPVGPGAPSISATTSSSAIPGEAPLLATAESRVFITAPSGQTAELPTAPITDGVSSKFSLDEPGQYTLNVTYGNEEVPETPFKFDVVSAVDEAIKPSQAPTAAAAPGAPTGPGAVKAYGPGLKGGVPMQPATFTVDTREAGLGELGLTIEGPAESQIDYNDNGDGTCDVTYIPPVLGDYTINVTYNEEHIKDSPFVAKVTPTPGLDVSGVTVSGPGIEPDGIFIDSPTEFTVDARSVTPKGEGVVKAVITNPSGTKNNTLVTNNGDGTYKVAYTPYEQGPHSIDVTYENLQIPRAPFKTNVVPGCDPTRVRAYGPGLDGAITNEPAQFTVDIKGAGKAGLGLAIEGPSEAKVTCKDNQDGTCLVEYLPTKPGNYDISVTFAEQNIPGSPFKVRCDNPVDAQKVKCFGPGVEPKGVPSNAPATFTVDTTEAGNAPLEVTTTDQKGQTRPAEIVPTAEGVYQATYHPTEEGPCKVDVNYGGKPVKNSPFQTRVLPGVDASKVKVTGLDQGTVPASLPVNFTIDTREAGNADLDILIQRPDGSYICPKVTDNGDGTCNVEFTPDELDVYSINVKFGGTEVPGSPFDVKAVPTGDASRCRITEGLDSPVMVGKETVITVDAAEAGTGKVTCRIRSPSGSDIDIDIVENGDGTFSIHFTPQFPGTYTISIKFGGQPVPQGDYMIEAVSYEEYQQYMLRQKRVGEDLIRPDTTDSLKGAPGPFHPVGFKIPVGPIFNFVSAYIEMPSGQRAYPKIEDNKDGTVTVRYQPTEMGLHTLHVMYNQEPIEGSPFEFHVDAVNSGYVTAYGPGLSHGTAGEPAEFTINTKDAGAGGLSLAVEGPSKAEINCKDNGDGTCKVTYLPKVPGEYTVIIKFADKHIMGSPFKAKITGDRVKKRSQVSVGSSTEVSLKVTEADIGNLTASIRSPSGREEPCILKKLPNGHLGISFTPREVGEHLVSVYRDEAHIPNSPFKINVGEGELGNASKVKAFGPGLKEGMANQVNEFTVNTKDAGYGGLSLSIEGPSKADIECHDNGDGSCRVTYKPTEPGTYIINIKFADEHVPGSPYTVRIGGEPSVRLTEKITRHREAADVTRIGSQCELSLKIPGTNPFDMTASVTSPSGVTELCDVVSLDDNRYSIKFVPKEMGVHTVSVKHKDMHIPGSPFEFTVGPITGGGSHKVHAAGPGLERGEVDIKNEFNIYTREAGAGGLSIAVEGPSKAEINFEDRKDGSCGVSYAVTEPGDYMVSIKFNDEHIPESPFRVPVSPSVGDAKRLSVRALQEKGLQVGKPAAFTVSFNGAEGSLSARVISPSGSEDEALIQEVDSGEFAVRFIPRENGLHFVHVLFNGCHIPGSPFKILVGKVDADPGKVKASGDGLRTGRTDQVAKFYVNTADAGSGALAVTVEGPSKVKLDCKEIEEGYEFSYTPTAAGDYYIKIRYAGVNIVGSPFKAVIEGPGRASGLHEQSSVIVETVTKTSTMTKFKGIQKFDSDASKVVASGAGLERAYRNKTSGFVVETAQAGNNILFVGIWGPKGPGEELIVKKTANATYSVNYMVKEAGTYMLIVKWGEENIPGSPFAVECK